MPKLTAVARSLRGKIRRTLIRRGVIGSLLYLPVLVRDELMELDPRRRRWAKEQLNIQREFDRNYQVDTAGIVQIVDMAVVGNHRDHGHFYHGTNPVIFRRMMASLAINYSDYVFIDFGSGKGKALLLAAEWPFKAIRGVEFAPALHRVAEANFRTYKNPAQRCLDLRSHCMDATEFELPADPLVIYFYNPFNELVLSTLLSRIRQSVKTSPRDVWACYYHPIAHRPLDESPFFSPVELTDVYRIYRLNPNSCRDDASAGIPV